MFSATFPANVENLAKNILKNPIEIIVGNLLYLILFSASFADFFI